MCSEKRLPEEDDEVVKLIALCEKLGAEKTQAKTMAFQLKKRSDQLAREHDVDRVRAMDYLIRSMISARQGITPPDFASYLASGGEEN